MNRCLLCLAVSIAAGACDVESEVGSNALIAIDAAPLPVDAMPRPACNDGLDNDGDERIDYPYEPGCTGFDDDDETDPTTPPACSNDGDDDGDLISDFPDEPGCESAADNDETDPDPLPECSDGIDNDFNQQMDYPDDDGCYGAGDPKESTVTS